MTTELSCKEVARLISDGLDTELPPSERARMRLHFVLCEACRNVNDQFALLRRVTRRLGQQERED